MPPSPAAQARSAQQHRRNHQGFIVVLNDNEWSIDKNVGAIARYFNASSQTPPSPTCCAKPRSSSRRSPARRPATSPTRSRKARRTCFPQRALREIRPALLRPDRRPRPAAVDPHLRASQDAARTGRPPHHHEKGRLPTRPRQSGQIPRPRQSISTPARPSHLPRPPTPTSWPHLTDFADDNDKIVAITAAMPGGTKLVNFSKATSRPLLRRRHRRGTRRALRLRPRHRRVPAVPRDLLHLHAARL